MPLNEGAINEILPFCPDGTEAAGDLVSLEAYEAHTTRLRGHQKGLALREVENRALRQALLMSAGVGQYIANRHAAGVMDNGDLDAIEEGLKSALAAQFPVATTTVPGVSRRATPEEIAEKTVKDATVSPADLAGLDGLPVGALLDLYGDDSAAPPGYLLCNGAAVTATYPALRAFGLARGWARNANGDPLLPDAGGYFRRGWRTGQVIDSGRVFGTTQGDAIRNVTGGFAPTGLDSTAAATGAFSSYVGSQDYNIATRTGYGTVILFDASRVVPTAADNRPYNYTCTTWIKAYPAATTPGSIDLANLVNDVSSLANSIQGVSNTVAALVKVGNTVSTNGEPRSLGVTYFNTSGKLIFVSVQAHPTGSGGSIVCAVNGDTFPGSAFPNAGGAVFTFFPVPPGGNYAVWAAGGALTLDIWRELR